MQLGCGCPDAQPAARLPFRKPKSPRLRDVSVQGVWEQRRQVERRRFHPRHVIAAAAGCSRIALLVCLWRHPPRDGPPATGRRCSRRHRRSGCWSRGAGAARRQAVTQRLAGIRNETYLSRQLAHCEHDWQHLTASGLW